MNIEDKVKKEYWYVLQRIKERSLKTKKGSYIEYDVNYGVALVGIGYPSPKSEEEILEKLEEMGVIKIIKKEVKYDYV